MVVMREFRRIVTGHDASGRSVIARDDVVAVRPVAGLNGIELTQFWGSDETISYPDSGAPPSFKNFFAPVGGFRFIEFTIPPDNDGAAAQSPDTGDVDRKFPGLMATMDPNEPGMHRSETIDLIYVVAGRVVLELDDGSKTEIAAGNVVVQSATMHAWRNPWSEPCRLIAVIIGAEYKPTD